MHLQLNFHWVDFVLLGSSFLWFLITQSLLSLLVFIGLLGLSLLI